MSTALSIWKASFRVLHHWIRRSSSGSARRVRLWWDFVARCSISTTQNVPRTESVQNSCPSFLYDYETWTLYCNHLTQLDNLHVQVFRSILGIRLQDKARNLEVLERVDSTSIHARLLKTKRKGHVIRMEGHRTPGQRLFGELEDSKRKHGRPLKRRTSSDVTGRQKNWNLHCTIALLLKRRTTNMYVCVCMYGE